MEQYESFDLVGTLSGLLLAHPVVGAGLQIVAARTGSGLKGTLGASRADNTWRSWTMAPAVSYQGLHSFAVRYGSLPGVTTDLFSVLDATGAPQLTFAVTSTGAIAVYRGTSGGTLLGTSAAGFVSTSAYRYLEFDWTIRNSPTGKFEVHSIPTSGSGLSYALTGLDTQASATFEWVHTEHYLLDGLATIDDCLWNNGNGVIGGGFRGDIAVEATLPTTMVQSLGTGFAPSTGTLVSVVDENPPNLDTDYAYARVLAGIDGVMGPIVGTGTIHGVQVRAVVRSISSGELNTFRLMARTSATRSGATQPTTTAYATFLELTTFDPATLLPWTTAVVNAASFGIQRVTP